MNLKLKKVDDNYIFYNEMYPDFQFIVEKNVYKQSIHEIAKLVFKYYVAGFNTGFNKGYYSDQNLYDG